MIVLAMLATWAWPAAAERLVTVLGNHRVLIQSSFTGEEIVLFGEVEQDSLGEPRGRPYEVIVSVVGPRHEVMIHRRKQFLGVWINADSHIFQDVPGYLRVLASNPLDSIASNETLNRLELGLGNLRLQERSKDGPVAASADQFSSAIVRLNVQRGLYREEPMGVIFLTPVLFRATIPLPAQVPVGVYEVDVRLFAGRRQIARASSPFEVVKVGFTHAVVAASRDNAALYSLATVTIALAGGWLAALVFRPT
jgi:uncharacterized protein (TIGR02186 family)